MKDLELFVVGLLIGLVLMLVISFVLIIPAHNKEIYKEAQSNGAGEYQVNPATGESK